MKFRTPDRRLAGMLCLGGVSGIIQVMLMREMLVVFLGNEVSIGVILSCWFAGIGLGAFLSGGLLRRSAGSNLCGWPVTLCFVLVAILPIQVVVIRALRMILDVPIGEMVPFLSILAGSWVILLPSGLCIGLLFPLVCHQLTAGRDKGVSSVSRVYGWEAAGSMLGGVVLTWVLLPVFSTSQILAVTVLAGVLSAALFLSSVTVRRIAAGLVLGCMVAVLACPGCLEPIRKRAETMRWRSLGVVGAVISSRDTVYQNLVATELAEQVTLYANGEVLFVLEDPIEYESRVHFIMAQKPMAQRVLLLGGNLLGDVPELLKYPCMRKVVCVDLDPGVSSIICETVPEHYGQVISDPRVRVVHRDALQFVRECVERFDVVLVHAPDPHTLAANRFYTREFFAQVRRILDPGGFMFTSVTSSERLRSEARGLAGSVYHALTSVFPNVLVTAGADTRFFVSAGDGITFDRAELEQRSRGAGLKTEYFDPRVFGGMDEIAADKTQRTEALLKSADVESNSMLAPTAFFYRMLLWSRFSGSRIGGVLSATRGARTQWLAGILVAAGLLAGILGIVINSRASAGKLVLGWNRLVVAGVIASTGFCAMSLEVLLIYIFQGVYGYVYTRMGLILAVFMLGLVLGAPSGRWLVTWRGGKNMGRSLVGLEFLVLCFALMLPAFARSALAPGEGVGVLLFELGLYGAVALTGWIVGAEFTVANALYREQGGSVGSAAAVTDAADHVGAALGSLVIGVVLVPVLGVGASCVVVAALKMGGVLMLWGIRWERPTPNAQHPTPK